MRRRGLPIAVHLGLGATLLVVALLGPASTLLVKSDLDRERAYRAAQFRASTDLLLELLGRADTLDAVRDELARFELDHARRGDVVRLALRQADGTGVAETGPPESAWRDLAFDVFQWPVTTAVTGPEPATLLVYRAQPEFERVVDEHAWGLVAGLAVLAVVGIAALLLVGQWVVTRPLNRLLNGIRQVGRGYPDALAGFEGAREWRQVAAGVRALAGELERTMQALVEAGQRAHASDLPGELLVEPPHPEPAVVAPPRPLWKQLSLRELRAAARRLEQGPGDDPALRALAKRLLDGGALDAERAGDVDLRRHLEDLAFRRLHPREHAETTAALDALVAHPPRWVRDRERDLRALFEQEGIPVVDVTWRVKHPAGVWQKARQLGVSVTQIRDVLGLRVVVPGEETCYRALRALQRRYTSQLLSFKDYVARPKPNGYRSLHATLRDGDGPWFEVQIRTPEMHARAEGGEAAHWRYKQADRSGAA